MKENNWLKDGLRFECQGSGRCCTSHGEYGYVYLSRLDLRRLARFFSITQKLFKQKFMSADQGVLSLKNQGADCVFLKNKRCTVYEARPTQCRTWPFWPEVLNAKKWKSDVASFCPGVGRGPIVSQGKILKIAEQMRAAEDDIVDR